MGSQNIIGEAKFPQTKLWKTAVPGEPLDFAPPLFHPAACKQGRASTPSCIQHHRQRPHLANVPGTGSPTANSRPPRRRPASFIPRGEDGSPSRRRCCYLHCSALVDMAGTLLRERLLGPRSTGGGEAVCPASEKRRPSAGAEAKKARSGPSCVPPPPLALPLLQTAQRPPFSLRSRPPQTRRRSAAKGSCFEKPEAEPEANRLWPPLRRPYSAGAVQGKTTLRRREETILPPRRKRTPGMSRMSSPTQGGREVPFMKRGCLSAPNLLKGKASLLFL